MTWPRFEPTTSQNCTGDSKITTTTMFVKKISTLFFIGTMTLAMSTKILNYLDKVRWTNEENKSGRTRWGKGKGKTHVAL